jgi:hypothetical protein
MSEDCAGHVIVGVVGGLLATTAVNEYGIAFAGTENIYGA